MKLDEIKQELKGYFIYKDKGVYELGLKQGRNYRLITDNIDYLSFKDKFTLTPIRYLLMQINQQLLDPLTYVNDLSDVIPVIDFSIFQEYDNRELEIDNHRELLNQIIESRSIFNRKKDFKLVYVKSHNYLLQDREQVGYYVIKDNDVVPIDSALLEDDYIKNAVEVKNLDSLKKALKDDLINQYTEKYKEEIRKWESLN